MAVPRNRMSNARKNSRRAHHAKVRKHTTPCSNCNKQVLSHMACPYCGFYSGRSTTHASGASQ